MSIRCLVCNKGPTDEPPTSVFRVNATGQKGIWACAEHIKQTDAEIDPEVQEIVSALEGK